MTRLPKFNYVLLHPRYWLTWVGIIFLYVIVLLPYPLLYYIGCLLGRLSMQFLKYRVNIVKRNLELCFPNMSVTECKTLIKLNFQSLGMGLIETGMAWFWPNWRICKLFEVRGLEHISKAISDGKGVLLIGIHFLTLELGARIFGIYNPGIGVYRPNDNALINWLQTWGRMRSNKNMLDRKDLKGIIRALQKGDIIWYAPDQDYGPQSSVFVPFFGIENAATTRGSYVLIRIGKPAVIPFVPRRLPYGKGYQMIIFPEDKEFPLDNEIATVTHMNHIIENSVLMAPDQYMWLHRRFKTRPIGQKQLYF